MGGCVGQGDGAGDDTGGVGTGGEGGTRGEVGREVTEWAWSGSERVGRGCTSPVLTVNGGKSVGAEVLSCSDRGAAASATVEEAECPWSSSSGQSKASSRKEVMA